MLSNKLANPAPLGLLGFGMTTVLLNLHNAGLLDATSLGMIFSMGIFYGGVAQFSAGMWEMKKGNTFAATAFTSYGLFWLSFVALKLFPIFGWTAPTSSIVLAAYLAMWGLFTLLMTVGALNLNKALVVVLASLTLLFFLLALGDATGIGTVTKIAGYVGIFCGFSAVYLAIAEVLNEVYGRVVLPIGPKEKK
jgi:succinate-acetate transporter protein